PHRPPGRRARPAVFLDRARGAGSTRARPAARAGPREPGGGEGTRTPNPLLAKQVRYQRRHAPGAGCRPGQPWSVTTSSVASAHRSRSACCSWSFLASATAPRATTASPSKRFTMTPGGSGVGLTGLEPVTSSLSGKRSNRLSPRPLRRAAGWRLAPDEVTARSRAPPKRPGVGRPVPPRGTRGAGSLVGEGQLRTTDQGGADVVEERRQRRQGGQQDHVDDADD